MLVCFSLRLLAEGSKTGDVFADYVEFDIDLLTSSLKNRVFYKRLNDNIL